MKHFTIGFAPWPNWDNEFHVQHFDGTFEEALDFVAQFFKVEGNAPRFWQITIRVT